jgi:NAD(P)-dependent dehydrogenase (short-subunit alcohol dehydrogenase family)
VRACAGQGSSVGFLDGDAAAGAALAQATPQCCFEACDVRDVAALRAAVATLQRRLGGVDMLVNNVANDERHRIEEVTPEYFDERIAVNLRRHKFATQAVLASMRERGGGTVVNIGSGSWKNKTARLSIYVTAKCAMLGLTRALARDLGPHGIRVNCVVPGWVMTERQRALWLDEQGVLRRRHGARERPRARVSREAAAAAAAGPADRPARRHARPAARAAPATAARAVRRWRRAPCPP